ncbi:MAG: hypothetical protein AAGE03_12790 [Pseudomonadota bacterium]
MIRPEAAAALSRWRDVLIGAAALVVGAVLVVTSSGLPTLFGLALLVVGGVLGVAGLRRARFRTGAEGPGLVRIDEGRILYMGPETGGMVALDDLAEVALHRAVDGPATWHLIPSEGPPLLIPEGAQGADALLDALAPLPGLDGGAMVRAVQSRTPGLITVWRRDPRLALT